MIPPEPTLQPLPRLQRRLIFIASILTFIILVPALAFYAAGYRLDLDNELQNIKTVGGMYVSAGADDVEMYIDDEPVEDMRIFQQAAYIQNLDAGVHQVHVQGDDLQTWVKQLPVYAHLVTESVSFNMPSRPQIRLIAEYQTGTGAMVVGPHSTGTFAFASTTNQLLATSTTATSSFSQNAEFAFVQALFASSTEERELIAAQTAVVNTSFQFASATTSSSSAVLATTTKLFRDTELRESGQEVFAIWRGDEKDQPFYYCNTYLGASTSDVYGQHVYDDLLMEYKNRSVRLLETATGTDICRKSIRIDRLWQEVQWFDFYPDSQDLVLLLLWDGLHVVEIDDRAWQNTQLLYPGENLEALRNGNQILIKDGDYYLEVFTELQS